MARHWLAAALCALIVTTLPRGAQPGERALELQLATALIQKLVSDGRAADSEAARGELLAQNPALRDLEVRRDGDRITLSFTPRDRGSSPSLYLAGPKRDFYLLAMAENPGEVLARLSGLDPQIRSASASRSGPLVTLRLAYAVAEAASAPGQAQPQPVKGEAGTGALEDGAFAAARGSEERLDQYLAQFPSGRHAAAAEQELEALRSAHMQAEYEAAMAAGRPEAIQAFMAKWAGGAKAGRQGREVRLQVHGASAPFSAAPAASPGNPAPAAAPPNPPAAPEPSAEARAEAPYRAALAQGTVDALAQFVAAFPDAPQRDAANRRMDELREEAAFRVAVEKNTVEAYQGFLALFPGSGRRAEAEARTLALEAQRGKAELERQAQEAERRTHQAEQERRQRAYEEARRLDAPEAYRIFLATYPGSAEAQEADRRLKEIEADAAAFAKARETEAGLERYLAERPKGRHVPEARERLGQVRGARMEAEFQAAQAADSAEALQAFLSRWPGSTRAPEAQARVETLKKAAARAERVEPPVKGPEPPAPPLRLAVRRVPTGPVVDGSGEDAAWREAQALDVPIQGPGGASGKVRVKAVHDGAALYLLAEWADPTRNESYRPWMWDAKAGNYVQSGERDDAFAVSLYRDGSALSACMLGGEEVDADLWLWRAGWGALSSLADDGRLRVSRERIPQANPYPVRSGQGQVWIRQDWDEGAPGWTLFLPVERTGGVVPSYKAAKARGSRGDVRASGAWSEARGGSWRVELSRALDTGHPDDVPLKLGAAAVAAFATYDKADRAEHASSPPVFLDVQGL